MRWEGEDVEGERKEGRRRRVSNIKVMASLCCIT